MFLVDNMPVHRKESTKNYYEIQASNLKKMYPKIIFYVDIQTIMLSGYKTFFTLN